MNVAIARSIIIVAGITSGIGVLCACSFRKARRGWKVAGVHPGMSKKSVLDLKHSGRSLGNEILFPFETGLISVEFDDEGLAAFVRGFSLEGPEGTFRIGDSLDELRRSLGEPDSKNDIVSRYFRKDLVIQVGNSMEKPSTITNFEIFFAKGRVEALPRMHTASADILKLSI